MCVTVNQYQSIISKFETEVYPTLNNLLSEVINIHDEHHVDDSVVAHLKAEIISLEKFERKLIFPAVISMFNETNSSSFSPNIAEIVQLTNSKEERIKQEFSLLEEFIDETNCLVEDTDIELRTLAVSVFEIMSNQYFPLKKQWYTLLGQLNPAAVNCKNRAMGKCKCGNDLMDAIKANQLEAHHH